MSKILGTTYRYSKQTPQMPSMHWMIVLLLSVATLGLFAMIWTFRQAIFIRKIDPSRASQIAPLQLGASLTLVVLSNLFSLVNGLSVARGGESKDLPVFGAVVMFLELFLFFSAIFQIRRVLMNGYGVQMSSSWTVVLGVFYIQNHMCRIAEMQLPFHPSHGGEGESASIPLGTGSHMLRQVAERSRSLVRDFAKREDSPILPLA